VFPAAAIGIIVVVWSIVHYVWARRRR
jgi:hypothetical protein